MYDTDDGPGAPGRPRRAEADILSYIRSLEGLIEKSVDRMEGAGLRGGSSHNGPEKDGESDGEEDGEEGGGEDEDSLLVENLIEELNHKFASVAMDRHAAPVMEKVVRLCSRIQLAKLLDGCVGYAYCLATNRYASHVLQTLLSLVGPLLPLELENGPVDEGGDDAGEEGQEVTLEATAVKLAQELHTSFLPLMQDICGTHTIRALFALLTGMPVVAEKRGRYSKHQHSIETAVTVLGSGGGGASGQKGGGDTAVQRAKLDLYPVPDAFHMMLESIVHELSKLSLPTLHEAICHPYSGPALCFLVQAVARSESPDNLELSESGAVMCLLQKALCWSKPERCSEVVYAMAGEAVGSRFLEALIWYTPQAMVSDLFTRCLAGKVLEYVQDDVANFVVQAFLQRTNATEHLRTILDELADSIKELIEGRRAGVVWRLAGASLRLKKYEKKVTNLIIQAVGIDESVGGGGSKKKGMGGKEEETVVRALLQPKITEEGRLHVNVPGARLLDCLLRMRLSMSRSICKAVADLPVATLEAIAKDNVASRAVIDPVLAQCEGGEEEAIKLAEGLTLQLKGRYADLAAHPVGFHVLSQCFGCVGCEVKAVMAQELVASESRLAGMHFGRRALTMMAIALFRSNRSKWESSMKRGEKKKKVLEELFSMMDVEARGHRQHDQQEDVAGGDSAEGKKSKKHKKKKNEAATALDSFEALLLPSKSDEPPPPQDKAAKQKALSSHKNGNNKAGDSQAAGKEGEDVDFILRAIQGSVVPDGGSKPATASNDVKRQHGGKVRNSKKRERGGGVDASADAPPESDDHEKRGRLKKRRPPAAQEGASRHGDEAPVEKARRLLGKRTMMSKSELLNAVSELEDDVKTRQGVEGSNKRDQRK